MVAKANPPSFNARTLLNMNSSRYWSAVAVSDSAVVVVPCAFLSSAYCRRARICTPFKSHLHTPHCAFSWSAFKRPLESRFLNVNHAFSNVMPSLPDKTLSRSDLPISSAKTRLNSSSIAASARSSG